MPAASPPRHRPPPAVARALKRMETLRKFCRAKARGNKGLAVGFTGCDVGMAKCIEILREECDRG